MLLNLFALDFNFHASKGGVVVFGVGGEDGVKRGALAMLLTNEGEGEGGGNANEVAEVSALKNIGKKTGSELRSKGRHSKTPRPKGVRKNVKPFKGIGR